MLTGQRIFQIDFHSELRKLIAQRFKSKGDYLSELVRLAARSGPSRIDVRVGRSKVVVRHDGAPLESRLFNYLYAVFDPALDDYVRHRSLSSLESHFGLEILAPFSRRSTKVIIDTPTRSVVFAKGHAPQERTPRSSNGFSIVIKAASRKLADEKTAIESQCRYAPLPIYLNGRRVSFGMEVNRCVQTASVMGDKLHGQLGIPEVGDLCRIVRLKNGVEFDKSYRSGRDGLVFHAVVEDTGETFSETWHALIPIARELYKKMSLEFAVADTSLQKRMLQLLFEHARVIDNEHLIDGLKVFELVNGTRLDLKGIKRLAARGPLTVVDRDKALETFEIDGRVVVILDRQQRHFLERRGFELESPPPRVRKPFKGSRLRALRHRKRALQLDPSKQLAGTSLDPLTLSADEHNFLGALQRELTSGAFILSGEDTSPAKVRLSMSSNQKAFMSRVEGADGSVEYRLARRHRFTRSLVKKVTLTSTYIYPALQFMALGSGGYTSPAVTVQKQLVLPY